MRAQLPRLETTPGLFGAAVAIALHGDPTLLPEQVEIELDRITDRIRGRVHGDDQHAVVAHAHELLFDELGFAGSPADDFDPASSYIHEVIARRHGLPILLTLVYKLVIEPLGPTVQGVNAPGHFVALVHAGKSAPMLVDPHGHGRLLTREELVLRVRELTGEAGAIDAENLPIATHRAWVQRMLRNLIGVYHVRGMAADRAAAEEFSGLLHREG